MSALLTPARAATSSIETPSKPVSPKSAAPAATRAWRVASGSRFSRARPPAPAGSRPGTLSVSSDSFNHLI